MSETFMPDPVVLVVCVDARTVPHEPSRTCEMPRWVA